MNQKDMDEGVQKQLSGFCLGFGVQPADVDAIVQKIWAKVLEKEKSFGSTEISLLSFAKGWGVPILYQYHHKNKDSVQLRGLFSNLPPRFLNFAQGRKEKEIVEIVLIYSFRQGETWAFEQIYEHYKERVKKYMGKRLRNESDREDLEQQTWIEVLKNAPRYDPVHPFEAFVIYWAKIMVRRHFQNNGLDTSPAEDEQPDTAEPLTERIQAERIRAELLVLVLDSRSQVHHVLIYIMCQFLDWQPGEIAEECSFLLLDKLAQNVEKECTATFVLLKQYDQPTLQKIQEAFQKLYKRLLETFGASTKADKTRETYAHLLLRRVGKTRLEDYKTGAKRGLHDQIADWRSREKGRMLTKVEALKHGPVFEALRTMQERGARLDREK